MRQITIRILESETGDTFCVSNKKRQIETKKICYDRRDRSRKIFTAAKTIRMFHVFPIYIMIFSEVIDYIFSHLVVK